MINATQSYRNAQINTVGRADVTLMLFDGLLRFLDLAAENMTKNKIQEKGNYISRSLDIINELDCTLNMEQGGEVSKGLHNLYLLMNKNLLMANLKNDLELLQSVKNNMQIIRDTFSEAMQTPEAKQVLAQMGPLTQGGATSVVSNNMGGSIQERANQIKVAQDRANAIEQVKKKLELAKTEEEKALAKQELQDLLGSGIVKKATKPVSMAMAQKANRAFAMQQNAMARFGQNSGQLPKVTDQGIRPQSQNEVVTNVTKEEKQNVVSQKVQADPVKENTLDFAQTLTQTHQEEKEQQRTLQSNPNIHLQMQQPANAPMSGGLRSKKISLYKNI